MPDGYPFCGFCGTKFHWYRALEGPLPAIAADDMEMLLREIIPIVLANSSEERVRTLGPIKPDFELDEFGIDSLSLVEMVMDLEAKFELPDTPEEDVDRLKTLGDVAAYVKLKQEERSAQPA